MSRLLLALRVVALLTFGPIVMASGQEGRHRTWKPAWRSHLALLL